MTFFFIKWVLIIENYKRDSLADIRIFRNLQEEMIFIVVMKLIYND